MGSTIFIRKGKEKQRLGKAHVQLLLQEIITQVTEFKHIYSQGHQAYHCAPTKLILAHMSLAAVD